MNQGMHGLRSDTRGVTPRVLLDQTLRGRRANIEVPLPANQYSLLTVIGQDVVLAAASVGIEIALYNSANVRGGRALLNIASASLTGPMSFKADFVVGSRTTMSSWCIFESAAGAAAGATAGTALAAGAPPLSRLEIPHNIISGRIAVYGMLA